MTDPQEATQLLRELSVALNGFLEAARANQSLPLAPLEPLAARLVDGLGATDALMVGALDVRGGQGSLAAHCIHVAIFAIRIAAGMELPRAEQVKVALAGLLHDVGMVRFPPDFTQVERALTAREQEELKRHPEEGYKILSALGPAYKWLADVAHQEHERDDGSGYPRGLTGDQILETARIVALADIYESVTHPRAHRKALVPFDAVREILTTERRRFSERVVKGLLKGLSAFPVGSLVRLNTREVARVVATNPAFPMRPAVEVLFDAAGDRVQGRRIDLARNSLQYIVDSVTVHEVL
ncbi:MAG TPA: HD domain-containing phosphohydrolase [Candidatus Methylomirabilis sp.]|jgi:HD-GYP domain-containing protein (c-di-GMP phosphodiesterase class II)|nr:HD domain-containing phosphohydrolase [Candidatus Methylomirabilis sp.]